MEASGDQRSSFGEEVLRLKRLRKAGDIAGLIEALDGADGTTYAFRGDTYDITPVTEAIRELRKLGDVRAVEPIGRLLSRDSRLTVRSQAAIALGRLGGPKAEELLKTALRDSHPSVRIQAANGLKWIGSTSAIGDLIDALQDDNPKVRLAIAKTLVRARDRRAIRPLREAGGREGVKHPLRRGRLVGMALFLRLAGRRT